MLHVDHPPLLSIVMMFGLIGLLVYGAIAFLPYKTFAGWLPDSTRETVGKLTIQSLTQGDLVVHVDHGIGRFVGLSTIEAAGAPSAAPHFLDDRREIHWFSAFPEEAHLLKAKSMIWPVFEISTNDRLSPI